MIEKRTRSIFKLIIFFILTSVLFFISIIISAIVLNNLGSSIYREISSLIILFFLAVISLLLLQKYISKYKNEQIILMLFHNMKNLNKAQVIIKWISRILAIIFIIFISLFALDVFSLGYSFWETIIALIIHLVPSLILTILAILAWKDCLIGGISIIIFSIIFTLCFNTYQNLQIFLITSAPLLLIGSLFLLCKWLKSHKP